MPTIAMRVPLFRIPKLNLVSGSIKAAMEKSSITIPALAKSTGISKRILSQLCSGRRRLTIRDAHLIGPQVGLNPVILMMSQQAQEAQSLVVSGWSKQINHKKTP